LRARRHALVGQLQRCAGCFIASIVSGGGRPGFLVRRIALQAIQDPERLSSASPRLL
jgi:hypothetical protein